MPTLTAESTFTVTAASIEKAETSVIVVAPGSASATGQGRLVHPTLGVFDYPYAPDEWTNMDGDVIVAPIWESTQTLNSGQNTLWQGDIKDTVCTERWTGEAAMTMGHLRTLIAFWMNPPDPGEAYVLWYPSYINENGYKVVLRDLRVAGDRIGMTHLHKQGLSRGPVELALGVVDYA